MNEKTLAYQNLESILLRMRYDSTKTLTENKSSILEQPYPYTQVELKQDEVKVFGPFELTRSGDLMNYKIKNLKSDEQLVVAYKIQNFSKHPLKFLKYNVVSKTSDNSFNFNKNVDFTNTQIEPNDFEIMSITIDNDFKSYKNKDTNLVFENCSITLKAGEETRQISPIFTKKTDEIQKILQSFVVTISPKQVSLPKKVSPFAVKETYNWVKSWDKHDWLTFVEIGASLASMLTPAGWIAGIMALGAGGANAYFYFKEGDNYLGWLSLTFAVIGSAEIIRAIPIIQKYGVNESLNLLYKSRWGGKLTEEEAAYIAQLEKQISENSPELIRLYKNALVQKILLYFKSLPAEEIAKILTILKHTGKWVGTAIVIIGGMTFTFDKIYSILSKDEKTVNQKSALAPIYNLVNKNNGEDTSKAMMKVINANLVKIDSSPQEVLDSIYGINSEQSQAYLDSINVENKKYLDSLNKQIVK